MHRRALPTLFAAALCLGLFASPALAQLSVSVTISDAPPPPRHEVVHHVRPGWVWVPGTWYWEDGRHRWDDGRWVRARPGQHWVPARWERRDAYYRFVAGGWAPDYHEVRYDDDRDDKRGKHKGWHDRGRGRGNGKGYGHPGDKGHDD